jgi:hypothetical protein
MIGVVLRLPSLAPYGDGSCGHRQPGGAEARVFGRELLEVVGQIGDRPAGHGRYDVVDGVGGKTARRLPPGSLGARFRPVVDPPVDPLACPLLFASVAQLADGRGQKIDAPALLIFRRRNSAMVPACSAIFLSKAAIRRSWPALSASSSLTRFCITSRL